MLSLALDAAPVAQMIVGGDGRMAYANLAFDHLFPGRVEPPLERIERSLAADPKSVQEFLRCAAKPRLGSAQASQFLSRMRAAALSAGSTFRQVRLLGVPDTAF